MLLFSQFTSMLEILKKRLEEEKISYFMITGATPKEKRLAMVKAFNEGDTPVFLISLKAGGVGLNLTGADMGDSLRSLVEPGGAESGHRPGPPHRAAEEGHGL